MPHYKRTFTGVLGGFLGLVGLSAVAGILVTATVTPAIAMTGLAGSSAIGLFEELPTDLDVTAPMEPTNIWVTRNNGDEVKIASFYDQNRIPVSYGQVAPVLYDALLSSEDKAFYDHSGVNIASTASALVDYVRGTSSRGASTISQQYVKNVLVQRCEQGVDPSVEDYQSKLNDCWLEATNADGAEGMERKLQEMRYAMQIEQDYSKNEILIGYLNLSNFGGTTYGIEAAARRYFGVTAAKLNLNQAATLAGMVQNPNRFRIDLPEGTWTDSTGEVRNTAESGFADTLTRRNYVLKRMLEDGKITQEQYDTTYAEPITPNIKTARQGCITAGAHAYFCQYVKSIIEGDPAFGATPEDRRNTLKRGGLDIYTTLDVDLQHAAIDSMRDQVPAKMDGINVGAAGVQIEVGTGRVLSLVQNTKFDETSTKRGYTSLVYGADSAHNGGIGFPVGSTYKLFTLVEWLKEGHSVNEILNGRWRSSGISPFTVCGNRWTEPAFTKNSGSNPGYTGSVMRFTSASLNTGFLAMAQQLDICKINQTAEDMGVHLGGGGSVTDTNVPNNVIGDKNIAPLDIANAYATVANKGIYCTPRAIDRIVDQDGKELPLPESSCEQVISPEVAATAAYALRGVMNGGTGGAGNPYDGTPLIGKTGTHEHTHTMLVESSTKVATAVWVGNAKGTVSLRAHGLTYKRFYLAKDMQRAANRLYDGGSFPAPDRNLTRVVYTDLPNVVGMTVDEATDTLEDAGFSVIVGGPVDSDQPVGVVGQQSPEAGKVAGGTTVTISPSTGVPPSAPVPNVVGQKFAQGKSQIEGAGFVVDGGNCNPQDDISGMSPGTAAPGATITLTCNPGNGNGNGNGNGDDD